MGFDVQSSPYLYHCYSFEKNLTQAVAVGLVMDRMPEQVIQWLHHHVSTYGLHFEKQYVKLYGSL